MPAHDEVRLVPPAVIASARILLEKHTCASDRHGGLNEGVKAMNGRQEIDRLLLMSTDKEGIAAV